MYIGEVGKRYEMTVTLVSEHEFTTHYGYLSQPMTIYIMRDESENVLVWKTSAVLGIEREVQRDGGEWKDLQFDGVRKGDSFTMKATVKAHTEYKGTEQTEITRVKVVDIHHVPTKKEKDAQTKAEQLASLHDGDFVWYQMPYKQYKEHYADCEIVAGSYVDNSEINARSMRGHFPNTVDVIIRKGRLVNSGVRGQKFHSYAFKVDGLITPGYVAITLENAEKRVKKDYPEAKTIEYEKRYW